MSQQRDLPLSDLLRSIGHAGYHLGEIGATEGAAGNISVLVRGDLSGAQERFPLEEPFQVPGQSGPVPELAGASIIVSGSGRRLWEISRDPTANLSIIRFDARGEQATLCTAPEKLFTRPTSELNSHIAIHRQEAALRGAAFQAVVHAQPLHIVYLSHLQRYRNGRELNRRLFRWQPETIFQIPEGIGVVPFLLPGSAALMEATLEALKTHQVALWSKHGLIVRSDHSVKKAVDLIEYLETAARFEYMNFANHDTADGLSNEEMAAFCQAYGIKQTIYETA
jgi:rhamnulose-1-phosphate aldolase